MNLEAIDFNLLKAFDALYAERNVTRAGARIGLAQPSMSNALNRLRALLDDELFVRTPKGMAPTARAEALAPKVTAALALVQDIVAPARPFDPAIATGEVTIASSDNVNLRLAPDLAARLMRQAPGIDLRILPLNKAAVLAELDHGAVDIAIGTFGQVPARFFRRDLMEEAFVCIARQGHPAFDDGMTAEAFAAAPQVLMTLSADGKGVVDRALRKRGLARRVVMTVAQFLVVPDIVAATDYVATIPESLAVRVAARCGCAVHPLPVPVPRWKTTALWSQSANAVAAKRYVAERLCDLAKG